MASPPLHSTAYDPDDDDFGMQPDEDIFPKPPNLAIALDPAFCTWGPVDIEYHVADPPYSTYRMTESMQVLEIQGYTVKDPHPSIFAIIIDQEPHKTLKDANKAFNALSTDQKGAVQECLKNNFYYGKVDFRDSPRCKVQNYILISFAGLIGATMVAKCESMLVSSYARCSV